MHIHFWGNVANTSGSVEKIILSFAKCMTKFQPIVASLDGDAKNSTIANILFYTFRENKIKNKIFNKIMGLGVFTFDELIPIIELEKPAILHFHNRQNLVDRVVNRLSYRPKVIVHYHRHFGNVVIPGTAHLALAVSNEIKKYIIGKSTTSIPIDVLANPLPDFLLSLRKLDVQNHHPILMYAGGQHKHKGFYDLLDAIDRFDASERYELLLAGTALEEVGSVAPNVRVLGYLSSDRYFAEMQRADIVVMPSHCEPFGLVALESMYLGKLLVASNNCGLAEFVDESCAILIEPKNPESLFVGLKKAIELVRSNDSSLRTLQENARQRSAKFLPSVVTEKIEAIYSKLLS